MKKYCAVDYGLGVSGVMVASLGARNGGSLQVSDLIQQLCDDITSYWWRHKLLMTSLIIDVITE